MKAEGLKGIDAVRWNQFNPAPGVRKANYLAAGRSSGLRRSA